MSSCKHPTQTADTAHIFGNCIVASEHNFKLWTKLKNQHIELQSAPCWFTVSENNNNNNSNQADFKTANWDAYLGNIGYIPTRIVSKLDKEQQAKIAQAVAESRHELWKDYWTKYVQLLSTTSSSNTASTMDDSGLVAISPTDQGPPVVVAESSLSASRK